MDLVEGYIKALNSVLDSWSNSFHTNTSNYNSISGNISYISYERTLSAYLNLKIYETIKPIYKNSFLVNEFAIKNNTFSLCDKKIAAADISTKKKFYKDNEWDDYCVFDGYFFSKEPFIIKKTAFQHFFVEYKLDDRFTFVKLATDFLKYKLFTKNINQNSAFCYIIIEKKENNPTVINLYPINKIYYKIIGKVITESSLPVANVYFYLPSDNDKPNNPPDEIFPYLLDIDRSIDELKTLKDARFFTVEEERFIKLSQSFKRNVLSSNLILNNYEYINKVLDDANKSGIFEDFKNISLEDLIEEGASYNVNLENQLTLNLRAEAEKNGFHASAKSSLNYLSLIDYFNREYLKNNLQPHYGSKRIGHGKREEVIKDEETARRNWKIFNEHFGFFDEDTKKRKICVLVYSLLSCISKIIPILYEKDSNGCYSEDSVEKDNYTFAKIRTKFDEALSILKRKINYKGQLTFSSFYNEESKKEMMIFLKKLFEFYE